MLPHLRDTLKQGRRDSPDPSRDQARLGRDLSEAGGIVEQRFGYVAPAGRDIASQGLPDGSSRRD
jgi:hypothetical protein